jgi:putative transposase
MTAPEIVKPVGFLREQLDSSPDLLRAMVKTFADVLMSADADAVWRRVWAAQRRAGQFP